MAAEIEHGLTARQRAALMILHSEQPTLQAGSGVSRFTFSILRKKGLARSEIGEQQWWSTALGVAVQEIIRERG